MLVHHAYMMCTCTYITIAPTHGDPSPPRPSHAHSWSPISFQLNSLLIHNPPSLHPFQCFLIKMHNCESFSTHKFQYLMHRFQPSAWTQSPYLLYGLWSMWVIVTHSVLTCEGQVLPVIIWQKLADAVCFCIHLVKLKNKRVGKLDIGESDTQCWLIILIRKR